jgi:hypothetical protein
MWEGLGASLVVWEMFGRWEVGLETRVFWRAYWVGGVCVWDGRLPTDAASEIVYFK